MNLTLRRDILPVRLVSQEVDGRAFRRAVVPPREAPGPALFGARELDQANLLAWRIGTGCLSWQRVRDEVRGLEEGRSVGQASVQVREGLDELQ